MKSSSFETQIMGNTKHISFITLKGTIKVALRFYKGALQINMMTKLMKFLSIYQYLFPV